VSLKLDPSNAEAGQRLERTERLLAAADFAAREEQAGLYYSDYGSTHYGEEWAGL
jgi:hypothetical protein